MIQSIYSSKKRRRKCIQISKEELWWVQFQCILECNDFIRFCRMKANFESRLCSWGLWTETQFHYPVHYNLLKQGEYKLQPWLTLVGCGEVRVLGCDWLWQPEGLTEGLGIFSETLELRSMDSFWFMSGSRALPSTSGRLKSTRYTLKNTWNKRSIAPPAQPAAPELREKVLHFSSTKTQFPFRHFVWAVYSHQLTDSRARIIRTWNEQHRQAEKKYEFVSKEFDKAIPKT